MIQDYSSMEFPQDWKLVSIREVVDSLDSLRVPIESSIRTSKQGSFPYYGASGIIDYIDEYIFDEELLLVAEDGANLLSRSTPIAFIASGKYWVNNHAHVLRPKENIDINYLRITLDTLDVSPYVTGSAQPKLNAANLHDIKIPLPPLTEQKRIASLLARADRLRHLRRTAHDLGESLLQSVFLEMFGDPEFNEKKWQLINLDDVCQNITDGKHGDCQPEPNSGYYFISAKDLRNGVIDYSEAREITYLDFIDTHKRTKLDAGDILLSNSGNIGKVAIANNEERTYRTTFQKSVAILKPKKDLISSGYLFSILKVMSSSLRKISDGSSQKNLLLQDIRAFSIPLPPLSLQEEFAGVVARVESLRGRMSEGERQVEGLFESLLAESFGG